jgi:transcriptional regulator with XRE-family HTH domain/predicted nucleotidyltransferase
MSPITKKKTTDKSLSVSAAIRELLERRGVTQDNLAGQSGLSRVQINRILNGSWDRTRPETRLRILEALGVCEGDLLRSDALDQFRAFVLDKHKLHSLAGLGFAEYQRLRLDSFYVSPNAVPVGEDSSASDRFDDDTCEQTQDQESTQSEEPKSAVEWISMTQRSVVLGVPGAGKTTLLSYMASKIASEGLSGADTPILVRLPEFALALEKQPTLSFIDWAVSRAEESERINLGPALQDKLSSDPSAVFFLLDGLDEVPLGRGEAASAVLSLRTLVIRAIEEFIRKAPNARYVLSSRINGFDPSIWSNLRFKQFCLLEYGDQQIREAVEKWSIILSTSKGQTADDIIKELRDGIFANERVKQLARNPLILTILILMCKSRGYALPRRRVDLYAKITEVFLDTWDASKRKEFGFREIGFVDLDPRELNWLIAELALEMQRAGLVTAHRWWIVDHLHSTLCNRIGFNEKTAKEQTDPILTFLSDRAGLFEQRMPGVYAFTHRTMQEYFAAIGLHEESEGNSSKPAPLPELMQAYLYHPEWSEVVRLVMAHVSPARAEELMKAIVDDPDPTGRFLRRGPLLALRCLCDGATISNRQFTQSVFDSFRTLGESPWYWLHLELFGVLSAFKGTRYEQNSEALKSAILSGVKTTSAELHSRLEMANVIPDFSSWEPTMDESSEPILMRTVGNETVYFPNAILATNDPDRWLSSSIKRLHRKNASIHETRPLIWWLRWHAFEEPDSKQTILKAFRKLIESDSHPRLREEAVSAFANMTQPDDGTHQYLMRILNNRKENSDVRAAAIFGLQNNVPDGGYEDLFLAFLVDKKEHEDVRVASAYKLESFVAQSTKVRESLLSIARNEPDTRLGSSCVSALQPLCADYREQFQEWSQEKNRRAVEAALVTTDEFVSGGLEWNSECVLELEERLMAIGKGHAGNCKPCKHMYDAIRRLSETRERLAGLTVVSVLRDVLKPIEDQLVYAFVYGSTARHAQSAESDIDLMLIGDVTQRELGSLIKKAESILGRELRPTTYTLADFAAKYDSGNRFVVDVIEKPKRFVEINGNTFTEDGLKNELRAMAKEQLAS